VRNDGESGCGWLRQNHNSLEKAPKTHKTNNILKIKRKIKPKNQLSWIPVFTFILVKGHLASQPHPHHLCHFPDVFPLRFCQFSFYNQR